MGQVHLTSLFGKLSLDNILLLFRCILFEKRILLVSSDYQRVIDVAELLTEVGTRVCAHTRVERAPSIDTSARVRGGGTSASSRSAGRTSTCHACRSRCFTF